MMLPALAKVHRQVFCLTVFMTVFMTICLPSCMPFHAPSPVYAYPPFSAAQARSVVGPAATGSQCDRRWQWPATHSS